MSQVRHFQTCLWQSGFLLNILRIRKNMHYSIPECGPMNCQPPPIQLQTSGWAGSVNHFKTRGHRRSVQWSQYNTRRAKFIPTSQLFAKQENQWRGEFPFDACGVLLPVRTESMAEFQLWKPSGMKANELSTPCSGLHSGDHPDYAIPSQAVPFWKPEVPSDLMEQLLLQIV